MSKPVGLLNVNGFWQPFLDQLDMMAERAILKPSNRETLLAHQDPAALLDALSHHRTSTESSGISPLLREVP